MALSDGSATGTTWYLTDNQGSVVGLMDGSSGSVIGQVWYDGFGNITETSGTTDAYGYGYDGRPLDPLTGMVYDQARWYDPSAGVWISQDPSGLS